MNTTPTLFPVTIQNHTKGKKMNKEQITELLAPFALTATTAKSAANRIESALSKTGTPAQLLSSVSLSMRGLKDKTAEDSSDYGAVQALESAFAFASAISKKGTEKAKGKTREVWADSQEEAIALKKAQTASVKPAKPKKADPRDEYASLAEAFVSSLTPDQFAQFLSMTAGR